MSLDELYATVDFMRKDRTREHVFVAALKGIDLSDQIEKSNKGDTSFEDVKKRAERKLALANGKTEQELEINELADLGLVMAKD